MKIRLEPTEVRNRVRVILRFGQASLVSVRDGRLELRGGSHDDRTEAKEYISLFMHEAAPKFVGPD